MNTLLLSVTDWGPSSEKCKAQSMAEAQRQKWYNNQKIGTMDLKPGDLVLVKADAFQGKRKIKDRWEDKHHEVVHQIVTDILSYEVTDQHSSHASYTTTDSSLSHQKLVFPCVCMYTKHRIDVPAPPQLSSLPEGMTVRLCNKKIVV